MTKVLDFLFRVLWVFMGVRAAYALAPVDPAAAIFVIIAFGFGLAVLISHGRGYRFKR